MFPYFSMMRPLNALMSVFAVLVGGLLVAGTDPSLFVNSYALILAMMAVFLIMGAGNAINDCVDVESDRVNKPSRPIPSRRISRKKALVFSFALFAAGILLTIPTNYGTLLLAIINSILLIAYSYWLQDKILLGNIVVGYLVGSTFLFGGAALGNFLLPGLLMLLAGLSTTAREIVKDLEDIDGDRKNFLKKLASGVRVKLSRFAGRNDAGLVMEKDKAKIAAIIFMLLAVIISPLPYVFGVLSFTYLVILVPADIMFISTVVLLTKASGKKSFARISKLIKIGMLLALMAFIFGVLF